MMDTLSGGSNSDLTSSLGLKSQTCAEKSQGLQELCATQESKLAVLWNIGIFALNFGPVVVGPVLDYIGPKLTAILGTPS